MFFKKDKFPTTVFVAASFLALITFGVLYLSLLVNLRFKEQIENEKFKHDKYFLNENFKNDDPYITKVPNLSDMLAGPIITALDPSLGPLDAPVNIVIFGDFTCSFCAKQEKLIKKIFDAHSGKIRFTWKDYPESNHSSLSFQAAKAARCAQAQDKFWSYHDKLFAQAEDLSQETFYQIAKEVGLNEKAFQACLESAAARKSVEDNITEAEALDIPGVPFMYVNTQEVVGDISEDSLRRIVEVELNRK